MIKNAKPSGSETITYLIILQIHLNIYARSKSSCKRSLNHPLAESERMDTNLPANNLQINF
jgi:hypothetical protein